jgi:predicted MFS family arabinose efflux permease
MGALGSAITYLTVSLHQQQGLSAVDAGFFLGVLQLGGVVGRVGWGMLSDRLGSRGRTMSLVGIVTVAASLAMAALGQRAVPALALGALVFVLGLSAMGWNTVYIALCAEAGPADRAATVVALGTTVTFTGMVTVTPVFGLIADRSGGFVLPWTFLAALTFVGVLLALGVKDLAGRGPRGGNGMPASAAD